MGKRFLYFLTARSILLVYLFQKFFFLHADLPIGRDRNGDGHIQVRLRITDTGGIDKSLGSCFILSNSFLNGLCHKVLSYQRRKLFLGESPAKNTFIPACQSQHNLIVNVCISHLAHYPGK